MQYPAELVQSILIAAIALVGFCAVFLGQIFLITKTRSIENIKDIRRSLSRSIFLGFITIILSILFFIIGDETLLLATAFFFVS